MTKKANRFTKFDIVELQHLMAGLLASPFARKLAGPTIALTEEVGEALDKKLTEEGDNDD